MTQRVTWRAWALLAATSSAFAAACATHPGVVVAKLGEETARVDLPGRELHLGDKVSLIKDGCDGHRARRRIPSTERCRDYVEGTGSVTRLLGESTADVRFEPGLSFWVGRAVERYRE